MPQLRQNMATKEWVIIASERAKRPEQFVQLVFRLNFFVQHVSDPYSISPKYKTTL